MQIQMDLLVMGSSSHDDDDNVANSRFPSDFGVQPTSSSSLSVCEESPASPRIGAVSVTINVHFGRSYHRAVTIATLASSSVSRVGPGVLQFSLYRHSLKQSLAMSAALSPPLPDAAVFGNVPSDGQEAGHRAGALSVYH